MGCELDASYHAWINEDSGDGGAGGFDLASDGAACEGERREEVLMKNLSMR